MSDVWDVIVIGAGPAGSLAAREAARAGARVLLMDKARFPRGKVCGCCVNRAALATLDAAGLGTLTAQCAARPVRQVMLATGGRRVRLDWPGGVSLSRERLDGALVESAVAAGAELREGTAATLLPRTGGSEAVRQVRAGHEVLCGAVVIVADGLGGRALETEPTMAARISPGSRIGLGATLHGNRDDYRDGVIHMAVARGGYVGVVRLEDGRLDIAAAVDPGFLRQGSTAADAVADLMREAGLPAIDGLSEARWHGTPLLTRRRGAAGHRLLVAGDAVGYVEPFTGEGMAWAMATGVAAGRLASEPWTSRTAAQWRGLHRKLTARRRRTCRALTLGLRHPVLVRLVAHALAWRPGLARPVIGDINTPAPMRLA